MPSPLSAAPAALARPLEDDWRASIDAVARGRKWPTSETPAQLGALVRALSDAYNAAPNAAAGRAVASSAPALAARLGFSFARDVPKSAAAVRELVAAGAVAPREGRLRVLDVGAGLGATTWGVARAFSRAGVPIAIDATWSDEDAIALDVGAELVKARGGRCDEGDRVTLSVRTERRRVGGAAASSRDAYDLVLVGQVLSELDAALAPEERVVRHVAMLGALVGSLAPGGALVVVEPALRDRSRHLHAVRDALVAAGAAAVFAPCLHAAGCPALAAEGEWCHEDLPVDLPAWLVPVARAAGLRWQGLTFSYLVLRHAGAPTLADVLPVIGAGPRLRVISEALVSKGKREHFVCGVLRGSEAERARVTRLDRDRADVNASWDELGRGDVIAIEPPVDPAKPRIARAASVTSLVAGAGAPQGASREAGPPEHEDGAPGRRPE
jgi:hypothetical protein